MPYTFSRNDIYHQIVYPASTTNIEPVIRLEALEPKNKTLSEKDIDQISKKIIDVVKEKTGATIRS